MTVDVVSEASRRTCALVDAVDAALPASMGTTCEHDDWPLLGWGMLASCAATARDVQALVQAGSVGSAHTLTRRLYELVVTLAWVCVDPDEHPARWLRHDRAQRLRTDEDLVSKGHEALLEDPTREAFAGVVRAGKQMPDLLQRAEAADKHWGARVDWLDEANLSTRSLRSMYRYLYRRYSSDAHGGASSVAHHVTAIDGRAVAHVNEQPPDSDVATHVFLLAIAYMIAGRTLGVVDSDATVDAIFSA